MPVVEPELLIDGSHTIEQFAAASEHVISRCVAHLWQKGELNGTCMTLRAAVALTASLPCLWDAEECSRLLPQCFPICPAGVQLEACLLKPQMVIPGGDRQEPLPAPEVVAKHTLRVMRRSEHFGGPPHPGSLFQ